MDPASVARGLQCRQSGTGVEGQVQSAGRGVGWVTSAFVLAAVIAIGAFGAFVLSERATAIADHEAGVARAEADASAAAAASAEDRARAERIAAQPSPTPYPSAPPGTYRVQQGDSIFSVSEDLGISVALLRHWNLGEFPRLASSPALEAGTLLAIDGPPIETAGGGGSTGGNGPGGTAPQPTPATAVPPAGPTPTTGNSAGGWSDDAYWTATDYLNSVEATYVYAIPSALWDAGAKLFGARCTWAQTPAESAACQNEMTASIGVPIRDAIVAHQGFMIGNPAAPCFADAYAADAALADTYLDAANSLLLTLDYLEPDAYYAALDAWEAGRASGQALSESFLANLEGYFADCG